MFLIEWADLKNEYSFKRKDVVTEKVFNDMVKQQKDGLILIYHAMRVKRRS